MIASFELKFDFEKGSGWKRRNWKIRKTVIRDLCNNISMSYTGNRQDWMPQNKNYFW
jgi:hypothetical protein